MKLPKFLSNLILKISNQIDEFYGEENGNDKG